MTKTFWKSCLHGVSEDWKLKVRLKDRQGETIVKTTSDKNWSGALKPSFYLADELKPPAKTDESM